MASSDLLGVTGHPQVGINIMSVVLGDQCKFMLVPLVRRVMVVGIISVSSWQS